MKDWRKKFEDFLKENYELLEEHEKNCLFYKFNCSTSSPHKISPVVLGLRIYKAKVLNSLPEELIAAIKERYEWRHTLIDVTLRRTSFHNIDYGIWDAVYGYRFVKESSKRWTLEVYVSSILRRPFTEAQRNYYSTNCFAPSFYRRLLVMYDSSNNDNKL